MSVSFKLVCFVRERKKETEQFFFSEQRDYRERERERERETDRKSPVLFFSEQRDCNLSSLSLSLSLSLNLLSNTGEQTAAQLVGCSVSKGCRFQPYCQ